MVVASGCGTAPPRQQQPLHVPPPTAASLASSEPREIDPGVLHGLLTEGELFAAVEGDTPPDITDDKELAADVRVCLDRAGTATGTVVAGPENHDAFDQAALAAVAAWRFRPYVDGDTAMAVCSVARFRYRPAKAERPPALPDPLIELPPAVDDPLAFPSGITQRPPTPGVAFARLCRMPGTRRPPRFTLLQSSGDPAFDRALFEKRVVAPADEPVRPEECWLRSGIVRGFRRTFDFEYTGILRNVAPTELEVLRISGDKNIFPSDRVKHEIKASGTTQLMVPVKICIDQQGTPVHIKVMKPSGHYGWEMDLINGMAAWRYKQVEQPVCSAIQFIYRQR